MADTPPASNKKRMNNVDSGRAYLILLACFGYFFFFSGLAKSLGVLLPTLREQFDSQTWVLGSVMSARLAIKDFSAIPAALLSRKVPTRWILLTSSTMAACSIVMASFATSVPWFAVCVSIFAGLGFGFGYPLMQTTLGQYFHKKYALAAGIATSGIPIGIMVMAPLTQFLLDTYGWRGALLVIGGTSFHLVAFSALTRPLVVDRGRPGTGREAVTEPGCPSAPASSEGSAAQTDKSLADWEYSTKQSDDDDGGTTLVHRESKRTEKIPSIVPERHDADTGRPLRQRLAVSVITGVKNFSTASDLSMFKELSFLVVLTIVCTNRFVTTVWLIYFVPYCLDSGFGEYEASLFVIVFGVGNLLGRILPGPFVDRGWVTKRVVLFLSNSLICGTLFVEYQMVTVPSMVVGTFLFGVGMGATGSVYVVFCRRVVGIDRLANCFGWTSAASGLVRIIAGFFPGWIFDHADSYKEAFTILACIAALSPAALIVEAVCHRFVRGRAPPVGARWECILAQEDRSKRPGSELVGKSGNEDL